MMATAFPSFREVNGFEDASEWLMDNEQTLEGLKASRFERTPWRSWTEWSEVYDVLKNSECLSETSAALRTIKLWTLLPGCPIAVEATRIVLECLILVDDVTDRFDSASSSVTSAYANCITRFATMYSDEQFVAKTGDHRQSLSFLMQREGIPAEVTDMRHRIIHKRMPDAQILKYTVTLILTFLMNTYWQPQNERIQTIVSPSKLGMDRNPRSLLVAEIVKDLRNSFRITSIVSMPVGAPADSDLENKFSDIWLRLYQREIVLVSPSVMTDVWVNGSGVKIHRKSTSDKIAKWLADIRNWVKRIDLNCGVDHVVEEDLIGLYPNPIEVPSVDDKTRHLQTVMTYIRLHLVNFLVAFPNLILNVLASISDDTTLCQLSLDLQIPTDELSVLLTWIHTLDSVTPAWIEGLVKGCTEISQDDVVFKSCIDAKNPAKVIAKVLLRSDIRPSTRQMLSLYLLSHSFTWRLNKSLFESCEVSQRESMGVGCLALYDAVQPNYFALGDSPPCLPVAIDSTAHDNPSSSSDSVARFTHPSSPFHQLYHILCPGYHMDVLMSLVFDLLLLVGSPVRVVSRGGGPHYPSVFSGEKLLCVLGGLLVNVELSRAVFQLVVRLAVDDSVDRVPSIPHLALWLRQLAGSLAEEVFDSLMERGGPSSVTHLSYSSALEKREGKLNHYTESGRRRLKETMRMWTQFYLIPPTSKTSASLIESLGQTSKGDTNQNEINRNRMSIRLSLPGSSVAKAVKTWCKRIYGCALTENYTYPQQPLLQKSIPTTPISSHHSSLIRRLWTRQLSALDVHFHSNAMRLSEAMVQELVEVWNLNKRNLSHHIRPSRSPPSKSTAVERCMSDVCETLIEVLHDRVDGRMDTGRNSDSGSSRAVEPYFERLNSIFEELSWFLLIDELLDKTVDTDRQGGVQTALLVDAIVNDLLTPNDSSWPQSLATKSTKQEVKASNLGDYDLHGSCRVTQMTDVSHNEALSLAEVFKILDN
eukprot:GHVH01000824.1.p1 GENE.GHVH01000824.1~~GHVH01000824.1.p1  ORF type:complete len:986 (-),score=112.87 GHVH01000824.1:65-3022(-)